MKENIIKDKSYAFALHIILFTRKLRIQKIESHLINQIMKSGTSIGANVEEADASISKAEFSAKISIAFKEARESHYWLRLFRDAKIFTGEEIAELLNECEEILRILWGILRKTRMRNEK